MTTSTDAPVFSAASNAPTISTNVVTMTPEWASKLLESNTHNRKVSKHLERLKMAMVRGEWQLNGEAIKVAADGTILDGQHRLLACSETGTSFQTVMITGLPRETQETMDSGKVRSVSDVLELRGYKYIHALSAGVTAVIRSEQYSLKASFSSSNGYPVTAGQVLARLEEEPELVDLTVKSTKLAAVGIPSRAAMALRYTLAKVDSDDADYFFDRLLKGDELKDGDAILTLRKALTGMKAGRGKARVSQTYIGGLVIKAWNKYRAGESATSLSFRAGGSKPEQFPTPL